MTALEFSRPVRLSAVPAGGTTLRLEANPAECAALAARLGLLALHGFSATLALRPDQSGAIQATGTLTAAVEQACVVSLEPVAQRVHEAFELRLLREGELPSEDPDAEDEVETQGGVAELGEVLAQLLALALDPYPRLEGAELPDQATDDTAAPFAALSRLRPGSRLRPEKP